MQHALTVIAKIKPGKGEELEALLNTIGQDVKGKRENSHLELGEIETLQFGRWALIPNKRTGTWQYLFFSSNYDGSLADHLNEFADKSGEAMDKIWGCCEGYPENRTRNLAQYKKDFLSFIKTHSIDYNAFYIGYRYETLRSKRIFMDFRDAVSDFFNLPDVAKVAEGRLKHHLDRTPAEVLASFNDLPAAKQFYDDRLKPAMDSLPGKARRPRPRDFLTFPLFILDFIRLFIEVIIYRPLRNQITGREPALNIDLDDLNINDGITDIEDVITQNQVTIISAIKPGWWTLFKLRVVLIGIHLVAKHFQNRGSLGGIATIHFARWVIIDKGRWLLFTSNYDGSWPSYIGDFVDKAAKGMDFIWTSAPRYPEQGAQDIEAFKNIIRVNQIRTQAFYSSVPDTTVMNLLNDGEISTTLDKAGSAEWLRRLQGGGIIR